MTESHLRLATWNIHMAVGCDGCRDLERITQVIREIGPDLIGLQEVDNRRQKTQDDLTRLQKLTGMEAVAGPTMQRGDDDYGNILLTRLPILEVERFNISVPRREPRGLLIVHQNWHGQPLQVAVTHLGLLPGERRFQVRRLIEYLTAENRSPLILMGDFNEWLFWGRPLRWLRRHFGPARSPATFPTRLPLLRLDHILAAPPESLKSVAVHKSPLAKIASDHYPLVGEYSLPGGEARTPQPDERTLR